MTDDIAYISGMSQLIFILRQKCAAKDNYFLRSLDVSSAEYNCLTGFFDTPALGIKDLSAWLGISPGGITRIIISLEEKGIVKRRTSPDDKRNVDVILTKKGIKMVDRIRRASLELHADIMSHIEPQYQHAVLEAMEQLTFAIDRWVEAHEVKSGVL